MSLSPIEFQARHRATVDDFQDAQLPGLCEVLATIPDPRARRGVRYGFTQVLAVIVAAVVSGAETLTMIAEWAADAHDRNLLPTWRRAPSVATIHRIMSGVDAEVLDGVVTAWVNTCRQHKAARDLSAHGLVAVAVDGKEVCGAKHGDGTKTMLMAALDHDYGTVIGQEAIDAKTNEIPHLPHLVDHLGSLDNTVITADALHTLAQQAEAIVDRGGQYVFTVKTNAKALHQAINDVGWSKRAPQYHHTEKAHGRICSWTLTVAAAFGRIGFPYAAQVLRLHRTRRELGAQGEATGEIVYAITSLPAHLASPDQLATLLRGHWGIENRLHWVRDTAFHEDASQVRTGTAARTMAVFRNLAISLHRLAEHPNLTATLRAYNRHPELALELTGL
jgi:predicted transposase YbfD/YdcC